MSFFSKSRNAVLSRPVHTSVIASACDATVEVLEHRRMFAIGLDPIATISGPLNTQEGGSLVVSGQSSSDPDGTIASYQWDTNYSVGKGFRARLTAPRWTFHASDSGPRQIALKVTDNDGNVVITTGTINVANVAPTIALTAPNNAAEGTPFNISWTHSDPGQSDVPTAWSVDWGDGQTTTLAGTATTSSHAYSEDGVYAIILTATQADGTFDVTHNITVDNNAPAVNAFTVTPTANEGDMVGLTFASPNRQSTVEGWVIDWGDGNVEQFGPNQPGTTHIYDDSGIFTATVTALEPDGGNGSAQVTYAIANINPTIAITGAPTTGTEGSAISVGSTLTDAGAGDTHTYGWTVYRNGSHFTLPGGTNTTSSSFTFTPTDNGSYVVRLTALDDDGGSTTVNSDAIVVDNADPTGVISGAPVGTINEGDAVNLTVAPSDDGSEDTFTYAWSVTRNGVAYALPDATTTDAAALAFIPRDNGTYVASVVVTDDDTAAVTLSSAAIIVNNVAPGAAITGAPSSADEGDEIEVAASVTDDGEDDTHTYAWSVTESGNPVLLPGGTSTTEQTFAFVPADNGVYTVNLTVTDKDGATVSTSSGAITVANVNPTAAITGDTTADEGEALNFNVAIEDAGSADTHTFAWSVEKDGVAYTLPGGTTISQAAFSFTPDDQGSYDVSVVVTDDDAGSETFTHTVAVANVDPAASITGAGTTGTEGTAITVGSTASDAGVNDVLTYAWSVLKDEAAYTLPGSTVTNTAGFTFTPEDEGSYQIVLTVTDADGGSETVISDAIAVANANPTAVISGEPVGTIVEGDAINLTASASDAGSLDMHTYLWSIEKDGVAYNAGNSVDLTTNTLSFIAKDNGSYVATVVVTDNSGDSVTENSQAIVATNAAPTAVITAGTTGNEGTAVTAGSTVTDAGTIDTHTYAWSVESFDGSIWNSVTLPLATETTESSFGFVPTDNGTYRINFTVTDNDGDTVATTSGDIVVSNVDPVPTISGGSAVNEGSAITLAASANDAGSDDTHTYAWSITKNGNTVTLPGGTVTNAAAFTFTPPLYGEYVASVTVTDDDGGSEVITKTITANDVAPVVTITGAPSGVRAEGSPINLGSTAIDAAGSTAFTYAWTAKRDGVDWTFPVGTVTNTSALSFTPTDNGKYVITLNVTDGGGAVGTASTGNITVTNALPLAVMTGVPSGSINEGTTVNLTVTAEDPGEEDTFSYAWTVTRNGSAFALPNGTATTNSTFSFVPTDNGAYIATCVVTDDDGGPTSVNSGAITVLNVNPTAAINGAPSTTAEGQSVPLTSTVTDAGTADTHTYAWSVTKNGSAFTLPSGVTTNAATFAFVPTDNGSYVASLTVTDKDSGAVTVSTSAIAVTNVAPSGTISGVYTANEGDTVSLTVATLDAGSADTLSYAWSVAKDGSAFTLPGGTVTNASTFAFVPTDEGEYVATLALTDDDGGTVTVTHTTTVSNVAPSGGFTTATPVGGNEGTAITVVSAVSDPGNDTLTYGWTVRRGGVVFALPNGTVLNGNSLTFTPTDNGSYTVRLTVLDGDGGSTTINTPSFTINNVNPQAAIVGAPASIDQGEEVELTSTASDVSSEDEAATLGYSWTVKRGDTLVETGSATDLSFTPTVAGTYTVTLVVTDKNGGATTTTKSIVATNLAPHSADISGMPTTLIEGESTTLTASASDVAGDTLTYSWNVLRNGVQFSEAAGKTFAFNPNIRGNFDVTMTATDVSGATSSKTIELTVGNVAPVVSATAPAETLLLGEAANFKLTFSDVPPSQGFTATWNFGDGTTSNNVYTSASTDLPRSHTYTAAGTYTMSVKISDGVDETVVTKTIVVSHAAIRTDALDANKKALYVYGTAAADNIKVEPGASSGLLKVTMNGTVLGTSFSQADRVIIEGRGGQNSIVVDGNVDTLVYAGQAGSAVTTSSGNDIIIGSSGADALNGRQGRDILIGQNGKDVFYGGDSEDLIVADIVNMTTASITKLVSQWGGDKTLAQRINDVRISGVFAAGKITNDGVQDNLFGELKGDWMLLNTSIDRLRDYVASADVIN